MSFERPQQVHKAPSDIVQLADKYKGGFQTHLHILASTAEIVSEEHRKGVIGECDAWLRSIVNARSMTTHNAAEIEEIKHWASKLR